MSVPDKARGTRYLAEVGGGCPEAVDQLFGLVYDDLRELASRRLRHERPGHTLQPTALVHEAFLRLVDQTNLEPAGRTHFFAIAAEAMRRILVESARRRGAAKRGGGWQRVTLAPEIAPTDRPDIDVLMLNEVLDKLGESDARLARVVELRFFGGLAVAEVAEVMGLSKRSIENDWAFARAWLKRELATDRPTP